MPTSSRGSKRSTCLDLSKDLVVERLSCLNLLGDPLVPGSQEVITPRPAQGPNPPEAITPQVDQGFDL